MSDPPDTSPEPVARPSAAQLRERIALLHIESSLADAEGLGENLRFMADLEDELRSARVAFVGTAVIEVVTLRAELAAPLLG